MTVKDARNSTSEDDWQPLGFLAGSPMDIGPFLRQAAGITAGLTDMHRHNIIHKDLRPQHILVHAAIQKDRNKQSAYCVGGPTQPADCRLVLTF